jgi:carbon-monoxide dehydrogenase small subunit
MQEKLIKFELNGKPIELSITPGMTLLKMLRDKLGLTGTKEGCSKGDCGACTVILNKKAVVSCIFPAEKADGAKLETIEGLYIEEKLHPLQESFIKHHAVQCGFCTPGIILSAKALLDEQPTVEREVIKRAIAGNLCRCTGYNRIIEAIEKVSAES